MELKQAPKQPLKELLQAFNRTSMELKQVSLDNADIAFTFNRTSMELKRKMRREEIKIMNPFNRTSMELKLCSIPPININEGSF